MPCRDKIEWKYKAHETYQAEVKIDVPEVSVERTAGTLDRHSARLDGDAD